MAYQYSSTERAVMAFITGISSVTCIPVLLLMAILHRSFEFYIGAMTIFTSVMYHVCESLDVVIYLDQEKWHMLDNIASICGMNALLISLLNCHYDYNKQLRLNLLSLLLVLVMQTSHPWELFNTITPVAAFGILLIYDYWTHGVPKCNRSALYKGVTILVLAFAMFVRGLDDANDYLRIAHSLWHVLIGFSSFYLWQIQERQMRSWEVTISQGYKEANKYVMVL